MTLRKRETRVAAEMQVVVIDRGGHEERLLSHDWSSGGVFLRTRHPLPPGSQVMLRLMLPGSHLQVQVDAVVVRAVTVEDVTRHGGTVGMGLRLLRTPKPLVDHLSALRTHVEMLGDELGLAMKPLPVVLLVGASTNERMRHAMTLELRHYDVALADDALSAMGLLQTGIDPIAVIVFDDQAPAAPVSVALHRLLSEAGRDEPPLTIIVGDLPEGLHGHLTKPYLLLPRGTGPEFLDQAMVDLLKLPPFEG